MSIKNYICKIWFISLFILLYIIRCCRSEDVDFTVLTVLVVGNRYHLLPHFLYFFEELNYPKEKLGLFIRTNNVDEVTDRLRTWVEENKDKYFYINQNFDLGPYEETDDEFWGFEKMKKIMNDKEDGLNIARSMNFHFVWFLDLGALHSNPDALYKLIKYNKTVVSPLLTSLQNYSNFWGSMTDNFWYERSEDYFDIITFNKIGCFPVAVAFESLLVNLNHEASKHLTFINENNYNVNPSPLTDNIVFSLVASENDIDILICNHFSFGKTMPITMETVNPQIELDKLNNFLENDIQYKGSESGPLHQKFDGIYCINLKRRPDRRKNMEMNFQELGIDAIFFDAIDWKELNETYLKDLEIRVLKNYDKGDMTFGLIGNFLSHYFIWEKIVQNQFKQVIILEDDVKFEVDFLERMGTLMEEIKELRLAWDLIYLGRRPMRREEETEVLGSNMLINPAFTWWTVGYMLSFEGARKLYEQKPLQKIIPIDEYIPIMFDQHPQAKFKKHYSPRDVKAFAVEPAVLQPTHYTNDDGYISDTSWAPDVQETLKTETIQVKDFQQPLKIEL